MSWNNFDNSMQNEGGYMDTTIGGGEGGGDKSNLKRGQNCIPVMIGQVLRHGEKLELWGTGARIVTLVAIVRNVETTSTKVSIEFQDETGTIKGLKWLEGDTNEFHFPVNVNSYARVYGIIREQSGEPYILIVNVQPMEHLNELLAHLMEVTLASLHGEKMSHAPKVEDTGANISGNVSLNIGGLNSDQKLVLDIIQNSDPEYGAERDHIKSQVPGHVASRVDSILEFLSAEGHIYTTKTDDFFKAI